MLNGLIDKLFTNLPIQQQSSRSNAGTITGTKQAKQLPAVPAVAQLKEVSVAQVLQMVLDDKNVDKKAKDFLQYHAEEAELIKAANKLLDEYSKKSSHENFTKLNDALPDLRDEINEKTDLMAGIIGEYALCKVKEVRKTFLDTVLEKDSSEMGPLFDKLIAQTTLGQEVDEKFKNRFLSYTLQSSKFATGEGRVKELMSLLGDRNIVINTLALGGPKAGQANPDVDNPKSEKSNARDKQADANLLKKVGGNLAEFVKEKQKAPDPRTVNPKKDEIGNLQIFMDKSDKLLPVYYGLQGDENVKAYASPMFTAVHHELGHLTNALKGQHGKKSDKYTGSEGALASLTDEEELQNISLDKFSDKAFTDELGLPERIAHGSLGGLDLASPDGLSEGQLFSDMQMWDERTYGKKKKLYHSLLTHIKTIADKYWGKYTNWKFKPSGVKKIAAAVETIGSRSDVITGQITAVKKLAATAKSGDASSRTEVTIKFYDVLSAISIDSEEQINVTIVELKKILATWFSD